MNLLIGLIIGIICGLVFRPYLLKAWDWIKSKIKK